MAKNVTSTHPLRFLLPIERELRHARARYERRASEHIVSVMRSSTPATRTSEMETELQARLDDIFAEEMLAAFDRARFDIGAALRSGRSPLHNPDTPQTKDSPDAVDSDLPVP